MRFQPPRSRNRLEWNRFEKTDSEEWELILPNMYADLFARLEPSLMNKAVESFGPAPGLAGLRALFSGLTDDEIAAVERFVDDFRQYIILGLGQRLRAHFTDELDLCIALDYNAESPADLAEHRRTPIGQLEFRAKYEQSERAMSIIAARLIRLLERVQCWVGQEPLFLTYMPAPMRKQFDLPRELVGVLEAQFRSLTPDAVMPKVVHPRLTVDKPDIKKLPLQSKVDCWEQLTSDGAVELSDTVAGRRVVVLDDLYQSGASMWSYAGYLRAQGAAGVIGVVCVKSCRDTDNL